MPSYYIGTISGTSVDGIDVVIVEERSEKLSFIAGETVAFSNALKQRIQALIVNAESAFQELGEVDVLLGNEIAAAINQLIESNNIDQSQIVAIGSHGQTLYHAPDGRYPFSLQIGNANVIAELTGITTIADFRQRDMVVGGQGAPLVPAFHQDAFQHDTISRVIVNIGGISNITLLPAKDKRQLIKGFDTGPGNGLMDAWCLLHKNMPYDASGDWAASGQDAADLLKAMLQDSYLQQAIPKSTGREHFNLEWLKGHTSQFNYTAVDIQTTLCKLTAVTIADAIKRYAEDYEEIYICGGGVHNQYLMSLLKSEIPNYPIAPTEQLGLAADWVEGFAFAWLARQTIHQQAGNIPEVTGASKATILGGVYSSSEVS
jgi:anhydro-N-acetylmuramic acid kinase